MADKEAVQLEEDLDRAEDKRSFSYMMEHPDEAQEPGAPPEKPEPSPDPKQEPAPGGEEETPEAKAAREAAEVEAAVPKLKFVTVEEYDKAYKEAETRMHTATGETVKEREAREAAEKRAEAAEAKLAEQERVAAEAAKPKALTEEEKDAIFQKAVEEISDLDRTDPDYLKTYSKILRRAVSKSGESRPGPDTETLSEEIANKAWAKTQAKQAAESAKTAEERQREDRERLDREANDFAKKSGLNMAPGSADYRLFWDIAHNDLGNQEFMKGDKLPPTEDQFKWVTDEAKRLLGQKVEQTDADRRQAAEAQKRNTVMGKGVTFATSKETPKTKTLSEMY